MYRGIRAYSRLYIVKFLMRVHGIDVHLVVNLISRWNSKPLSKNIMYYKCLNDLWRLMTPLVNLELSQCSLSSMPFSPRKYEYVCSRFSVTKPMRASWLKWKETGILDPVLARRLIRLSEIARKSKYVISIAKVNVLIMGGGKRR